MDRDTVRWLLIIAGAVLLLGIYLWGRFKQPLLEALAQRSKPMAPDFPEEEPADELPESLRESLHAETLGQRKEPQLSGLDLPEKDDYGLELLTEPEPLPVTPPAPAEGAPFVIQVSVVAGPGRFFHGPDLKQALLDADLIFGEMDIFHRYDRDLKHTLFSVASLVEPGTFPIETMEEFECPGIILFFQTARVADPLSVYDDLVNTSRELAHRLHGIQWDDTRQPLSASKVAHLRNLLKHPVAAGS